MIVKEMENKNKVILIGGVAGTGKTTVAKELTYRYGIYHRIGTGFIREIVKTETNNEHLDCHTYLTTTEQAYYHLLRQTHILKNSINACINRASREGTSLVLEGNHLIPWELENPHVTHSVILYVNDDKKHWLFLNGKSHKNRKITEDDFRRIREMQETLIFLAEKESVPLVECSGDFKDILEEVEKLIK